MEEINIEIERKNKKCKVLIGSSILSDLKRFILTHLGSRKIAVITDDNVKELQGKKIMDLFADRDLEIISIAPGESSKTRETKEKIENTLLDKKFGRDTVIIALGGGVTGDLAGFLAATFNRGVPLVHVPTTLLAMVDSSIGGKTGVNTPHGKNLIGSMLQPEAVFVDLDFIETLPEAEFLNGLAEIIKIAIVSDENLFSFIGENRDKILRREKEILLPVIKRSIELKKNVVEKDEEESGLRQTLNFGHTIGHALEAESGFKEKHGNCVSMGMVVEAKIATLLNHLSVEEEKRIVSTLDSVGLPIKIKKDIEVGKLMGFMMLDKKSRNQKPRFVILDKIGKVKDENNDFSFEVDDSIIKKSIEDCK